MNIDPAILEVPFLTGETPPFAGAAHAGHW
jgi:hypothetical protein